MFVWSLLVLVFTGWQICSSILAYRRSLIIWQTWLPAPAIFLEWHTEGYGRSRRRSARVAFTDTSGEEVCTLTDQNTSAIMGFGPGNKLRVLYHPAKPATCIIAEKPLIPTHWQAVMSVMLWFGLVCCCFL
uniref:DUF3592 domain-containing protein n=1 Tax=Hymenobacter pini TaxID=2880879 RepID=UPI003743643E